MKKLLYIAYLICLICSCKPEDDTYIEEDYDALFPFKGIDKPELSYEDMTIITADPNLSPSTYRYNGVDIPEEDSRDYDVTINCHYAYEGSNSASAFITLRYVGEDKNLKIVSSDIRDKDADAHFQNNDFSIKLRLRSGYPMLLNLVGKAPRGTRVEASISAQSVDGIIKLPKLQTIQSQNKEGVDLLPEQYCKYIILP